ncbi:hypothetical protein JL722_3754 [Aureococcus anophagefferens]|nr:hypothetical protein JL722_3754 [Aureococcus anophagefferens]
MLKLVALAAGAAAACVDDASWTFDLNGVGGQALACSAREEAKQGRALGGALGADLRPSAKPTRAPVDGAYRPTANPSYAPTASVYEPSAAPSKAPSYKPTHRPCQWYKPTDRPA